MSVEDERTKLLANFCNIVAAGFITTGTIGPLLTFLYSRVFADTDPALIAVGTLICLLIGGGIHLAGQSFLGALDD